MTLAFLCEAYDEEDLSTNEKTDSRTVLRFHPAIAPVKVAVLPLVKKLSDDAYALYEQLSKKFVCEFDEAGAIGRRYRRQDEIGTPFCITYDFQTKGEEDVKGDDAVTVRFRDSMEQVRMPISSLEEWLSKQLEF